ncbi:asparagine synthase-related protein [Methanobrevibacter sp.]
MSNKKEVSQKLRKLLIKIIERESNGIHKVGLMLSGGIDSSSILYSLLELNKEIHCYTFYLENYESKDLKSARRLCERYNLKLTEVQIPRESIKQNIIKLAKLGCNRKTQFETKIHYLYLFPKIEEKILFAGIEADNLQGTVRSMILQSSKNPLKFKELREKAYNYAININLPIDYELAKENGFKLNYPYVNKEIYNFYLQYNWEYLNKPYEKWILLNAFDEYFKQDGYRRHLDMQQASMMKDYCATLLNDKKINPNNRKRINEAYKDLNKKYGG